MTCLAWVLPSMQAYDRSLVRLRGSNAATNFSISDYRADLADYYKMQQVCEQVWPALCVFSTLQEILVPLEYASHMQHPLLSGLSVCVLAEGAPGRWREWRGSSQEWTGI